MAKILCVEDSPEFQVFLKETLRDYEVTNVDTIAGALKILDSVESEFEIILIDLSLPDGNGMKILPFIKDSLKYKDVPIIVISGDSSILTKVAAFGIGADDYIVKPPDMSELRARISARLRTGRLLSKDKTSMVFGDLFIDLKRMLVELNTAENRKNVLSLTPLEFKILCLLVNRPENVFSRELIIECIWGVGTHVSLRTVDAHISHLRAKLASSVVEIETALSFGYKAIIKTELKI